MRSLLLLPCLALTLAAQDAASVQAPITSVKLYPDEAWVTRVGRVQASAGTRRYRVGGLPAGLTLDDIQVSAKGPAGSHLGDVAISTETGGPADNADLKRNEADRESAQDRIDALQSQIEASQQEAAFLGDARTFQGKDLGTKLATALPNPGTVVAYGQGVQTRVAQLLLQQRKLKRELDKATEAQKRILEAWGRMNSQGETPHSAVEIEVTAAEAGPVLVQVSYRTRQARWTPAYEARLSEDRTKLELALYAAVTQQSGENWEGVRLEVSNARPSRNLGMPRFGGALVVGWAPPIPAGSPVAAGSMGAVVVTTATMGLNTSVDSVRTAPSAGDMNGLAFLAPGVVNASEPNATIQEASGLTLALRLEGEKEIPSDGEAHRFRLLDQSIKPDLALVATPRLDTSVYQVARFKTPGTLPVFPGAPLVQYAGSQRLGQAPFLQPAPGQPYQLAFGPYRGLRAAFRSEGLKQETVGTFTKVRQWTLRDRVELSSETGAPVDIEVNDPELRSNQEQVRVVELPETTPGAKEVLPGVRTWTIHLAPEQTSSLTIATQVRTPMDGQVSGLQ